jgi:DNA-binding NarL/FixJ family response regulator
MQVLSALVVDDHPAIQEAVRSALLSLRQRDSDAAVFERIDMHSALAVATAELQQGRTYDLLVLDLHLTDTHGLQALQAVRETFSRLPVIIFSADDSTTTAIAAYEHGVKAYVCKKKPTQVLLTAIEQVLAGGYYFAPEIARVLASGTRAQPAAASLSPRQQEVLRRVLDAMPNKVIGRQLDMADGTVKSHLNTIYRIYGVNSRAQLIRKAQQMGLI